MHNLYRERILDLYKHPLNFREIKDAKKKHLVNPLCGDEITLYLTFSEGKIVDASFLGRGCALCIASSSLLSEKLKGMSIEDAKKLSKEDILSLLEIEVSMNRLKCVLLCLDATKTILEEKC